MKGSDKSSTTRKSGTDKTAAGNTVKKGRSDKGGKVNG